MTKSISVIIRYSLLGTIGFLLLALMALISVSLERYNLIHMEWVKLSADYIKQKSQLTADDDLQAISHVGGYSLLQLRVTDRAQPTSTGAVGAVEPASKTYQFEPNDDPVSVHDIDKDNYLKQLLDTVIMLTSAQTKPLELVGTINNQLVGFTINQSVIYHSGLHSIPIIFAICILFSLPSGLFIFWLYAVTYRRPLHDLLRTLALIADDPTLMQPVPKSLKLAGQFQQSAVTLETLQQNMLWQIRQRERLADIGEAVAKINHDIRNVLSSATLVSDALLTSNDSNVRKSAPLVLRSLEQAVDMCQSMMDYLAQTPSPQIISFDLPELLAEIKAAFLLEIQYQGPRIMHADRTMMSRIFLNMARNSGTAGASKLFVEVWQVGHLAVVDINDNGSVIPRNAWPDLFSPFKSRQELAAALGWQYHVT